MFTISEEFKCLCERAPSRVDEKLEFCVLELIENVLKNSLMPGHIAIAGAATEALISYAKEQGISVPRTEALIPILRQHLSEMEGDSGERIVSDVSEEEGQHS